MRELKRSIAKATMRKAGLTKLFKRYTKDMSRQPSLFSRSWRYYFEHS